MAAVDPDADVEVVTGRDSVIARVPLAEAPGPWIKEYVSLARAEDLAAEVREEHGRIPPVVQVLPASRIGKPSQYWTQRATSRWRLLIGGRGHGYGAANSEVVGTTTRRRRAVGAQGSLSVQARGA
jgi:hypothetical protein